MSKGFLKFSKLISNLILGQIIVSMQILQACVTGRISSIYEIIIS